MSTDGRVGTYKMRLAAVRQADEAHEAMMKAAAQAAGMNLAQVRSGDMKSMDVKMTAMFAKARENGWNP